MPRTYVVVLNMHANDPHPWIVSGQSESVDVLLRDPTYDGAPWHVPKRDGDRIVGDIKLMELRTGKYHNGKIVELDR